MNLKKNKGLILLAIGILIIVVSIPSMQSTQTFLKVHSTYPFHNQVGDYTVFTEVNIYVSSGEVPIQSIVYFDSYNPNGLALTPSPNVTKNVLWIPDLDGDGRVDEDDIAVLQEAWWSKPQDENWNPDADLNGDNIIDSDDLDTLADWLITESYVATRPDYNFVGESQFKFVVTAQDGTTLEVTGSYESTGAPSVIPTPPTEPFPSSPTETPTTLPFEQTASHLSGSSWLLIGVAVAGFGAVVMFVDRKKGGKKGRARIQVIVLLLAIILIGSAFFIFKPSTEMTLVSLDKVEIEGVGWEDKTTHTWVNDYWLLYARTDTATEAKLIKFNEEVAKAEGATLTVDSQTGETKTVLPTSDVRIRITPSRPYYSIQLKWSRVLVYPKTYGAWLNKLGTGGYGKRESISTNELKATYYYLATPYSYILHTPYTAELIKNGKVVATKWDDSYGGKNLITLTDPNSGKTVKIENFGKGEFGYNPPVHGSLIIFNEKTMMEVTSLDVARDYIEYDKREDSYSIFWWGPSESPQSYEKARWGDDGSPRPFIKEGSVFNWRGSNTPGWNRDDDTYNYRWDVCAADVYQNNPSTNPSGLSLINWLLTKDDISAFDYDNLNLEWYEGHVITDNGELRLFMSPGAAYSDLVIRIPTELADAVVPVEYYPTASILARWATDEAKPEIGNKLEAFVTVENTAFNPQTQEGIGGTLITLAYFEGEETSHEGDVEGVGSEAGNVAPPRYVQWFDKGQTRTYNFTTFNTGTAEDTDFKIIFEVWNEEPRLLDQTYLEGTFTKTTEVSTIVTVAVRDGRSHASLDGIHVAIAYEQESDSKYTFGGVAVFDLGNMKVDILVTAVDPQGVYQPANMTAHAEGATTITLDMWKKGEGPEEEVNLMLWLAIGIIAVGVVLVTFKKRKKLKEMLKL